MSVETINCASQAAHSPHPSVTILGIWCAGVMPVWPCGVPDRHENHQLGGELDRVQFFCPGTDVPPTDITGPWYSRPYVEKLAAEREQA